MAMGFGDKQLVFGGAGPGTPWGTLGEVTARVLEPHGYAIRVDPEASRGRCPGLVSAGKLELGATQARILGGTGDLYQPILKYYGLSREQIESWGGRFLPSLATTPGPRYVASPNVRAGDVDLIMENIYAAYTPEANHDAFRQTHIPYSYDSQQVARNNGIPIHPGAARYYRERGYLART